MKLLFITAICAGIGGSAMLYLTVSYLKSGMGQ